MWQRFALDERFDFVWGLQRDPRNSGYKIEMLNKGQSPLKGEEPGLAELIQKVRTEGKFECTSNFSKIREVDAVTVAIQTPFKDNAILEPDSGALEEGLRQIGRNLRRGMLVVLESTITPGTTKGMAAGILHEESGLAPGKDFALAHAPEWAMVGRLIKTIQEHDRIVGGINRESTERAAELYEPVLTKGKIIAMDSNAAEVTKVAGDTFRDLQIVAANQLALYCEAMRVNVYDVSAGINNLKCEETTRAALYPGAGGHCLTKDTYHPERGSMPAEPEPDIVSYNNFTRKNGVAAFNNSGKYMPTDYNPLDTGSLYVLARRINDFMPAHMYNLTASGLSRLGKRVEYSRIALLGWDSINNPDDTMSTPAAQYYNMLTKKGAKVTIHDPYVSGYNGVKISQNLADCLKGASAVAILTGHSQYRALKPRKIKKLTGLQHPVIVDGRNVIDPDAFINEGFVYLGIGRGDKNYHDISN